MRSELVVFPSPALNEHSGLGECVKDLSVEQLVSELSIKRFVVAVLPRTSGFNEQGLGSDALQPLANGRGGELRPVVRTDPLRDTSIDEQLGQVTSTSSEFSLLATSIARHSLVDSSITVSIRNALPSEVRSMTKS